MPDSGTMYREGGREGGSEGRKGGREGRKGEREGGGKYNIRVVLSRCSYVLRLHFPAFLHPLECRAWE